MSDLELPEPKPITARDVVAAVIDTMRLHHVPIAPRAKGIIAKKSKELLEAGFRPEVVLAAAVESLRRNETHQMDLIAQDIALVQSGQRRTRTDTQRALAEAAAALDPAMVKIRAAMKEAFQR